MRSHVVERKRSTNLFKLMEELEKEYDHVHYIMTETKDSEISRYHFLIGDVNETTEGDAPILSSEGTVETEEG